MSWDVSIVIDTGGEHLATVDDVGNTTYNLSAMYEKALGCNLGMLDGIKCNDVVGRARTAIRKMNAKPKVYKTLNPPNGWGTYDGALIFLTSLVEACSKHPKASVKVV